MARCDGPNCDAEIVWAETPEGKRQPFNREPDPNGNRVLVGRGPDRPPLALNAHEVADEAGWTRSDGLRRLREAEVLYMPHHATCVDRDRFKGPRRG